MKADLTRDSFDPLKHYTGVLMQQGRVQLDADWNEQAAILLHLLRRLAADQFGPAFPAGFGGGFAILPLATAAQANGLSLDFGIEPGRFYVDGIRCELEATPVRVLSVLAPRITVANWTVDGTSFAVNQYLRLWGDPDDTGQIPRFSPLPLPVSQITFAEYSSKTLTLDTVPTGLVPPIYAQRIITYRTQPDLPQPAPGQSFPPPLAGGASSLIYLDVWERLITCLEDDSIREVALNGPDTAARARVVWQVKALPQQASCIPQPQLSGLLQPWTRGLLRARVQPAQATTDPCTISPESRYRGAENQLYLVEIHSGNLDPSGNAEPGANPSFKWSRDDGAVTYPINGLQISGGATTTVTLGSLGRDDRFGLSVGDYVEVQDDYSVLNNIPGNLLQVQSIDRTGFTVVLAGVTTSGVGTDPNLHPLLRRWDHRSGDPAQGGAQVLADGALPITGGNWLDLEDGVQVWFEVLPDVAPVYRSGDYWLIPARVATGDVIWPSDTWTNSQGNTVTGPAAKPPDGITHHYVSLALVAPAGNGTVSEAKPCLEFRAT
ncbi:MAG TPA: DUF6519 domain-containing protein [Caulobacteraceae bacterium]